MDWVLAAQKMTFSSEEYHSQMVQSPQCGILVPRCGFPSDLTELCCYLSSCICKPCCHSPGLFCKAAHRAWISILIDETEPLWTSSLSLILEIFWSAIKTPLSPLHSQTWTRVLPAHKMQENHELDFLWQWMLKGKKKKKEMRKKRRRYRNT